MYGRRKPVWYRDRFGLVHDWIVYPFFALLFVALFIGCLWLLGLSKAKCEAEGGEFYATPGYKTVITHCDKD